MPAKHEPVTAEVIRWAIDESGYSKAEIASAPPMCSWSVKTRWAVRTTSHCARLVVASSPQSAI